MPMGISTQVGLMGAREVERAHLLIRIMGMNIQVSGGRTCPMEKEQSRKKMDLK